MNNETQATSAGSAAPLDEVKQSVHSDLQYVSLQVEGRTYGGWYRFLPDGRMELLALANMHSQRRPESTPIEQARGMLADFIRAARPDSKPNESVAGSGQSTDQSIDNSLDSPPGTLGDLLYADKAKTRVAEADWVRLVRHIASGDQLALQQLFTRTHRVVFTLIMRVTNDRQLAEELTLDAFQGVWRKAPTFDVARESVLGWIMNQARSKAIERLGLGHREEDIQSRLSATHGASAVSQSGVSGDPTDVLRPSATLWDRLARRIDAEVGGESFLPAALRWTEPEWEEVAPGISCKLLATDAECQRVSMLVRLAPGVDYPPHTHAGVEELHLLHGELLIDDRKLYPGDYNRAEPGTADKRVWTETGCTCVLVTSTADLLG